MLRNSLSKGNFFGPTFFLTNCSCLSDQTYIFYLLRLRNVAWKYYTYAHCALSLKVCNGECWATEQDAHRHLSSAKPCASALLTSKEPTTFTQISPWPCATRRWNDSWEPCWGIHCGKGSGGGEMSMCPTQPLDGLWSVARRGASY